MLALGLDPSHANAATTPDLWGYGVRSCADVKQACEAATAENPAEYQRYEDWLTGFVSGLNLALDQDVLSGSGIDTAMRRTCGYCERHPSEDFFSATMDLIQTLGKLR